MKKWRPLLLLCPLVVGALYLRSLTSWRPQNIFAETGDVLQLDFSSDGKQLLVINKQQWSGRPPKDERTSTTLLDTQNGFRRVWQIKNDLWNESTAHFFDRDSKILLSSPDSQVLDARTGKTLDEIEFFPRYNVLSPDQKWLAYTPLSSNDGAALDGRVYIKFDPRNQPEIKDAAEKILGREDSTSTCSFSPDSKTLVVGVGDWSSAHLDVYDVGSWKRVRTLMDRRVRSYHQSLLPKYGTMQWSSNGKYLLTDLSLRDNRAHFSLWRIKDGKKFEADSLGGWNPKLQNDGRILVFTPDSRVLLHNHPVNDSKPATLIQLPKETISAAALSPDGTALVVGTRRGHVIWKRLK